MSNSVTVKTSMKHLRQVADVDELLINDNARKQLAAVATKVMNPERMMRVVASAIRTTPALKRCNPMSMLGALMQCSALGLEPNTVLGHAYLIPFNARVKDENTGRWESQQQVQLIVGYKGLIDLARRSGHITSIHAGIHYSDDLLWEYEEGTEARLRHQPGDQEGEKVHAYAIAKFKDGGHAYVVLPWKRVMRIRDGSSGWQSAVRNGKTEAAPWRAHEDAMARKTAIRALANYLPLSVEFMDALQVDADGGKTADFAAFALNPDNGVTIDGTSEPHDDGGYIDQEDEKPKTEPRGAVKDKPEANQKPTKVDDTQGAEKKADKDTETKGQPKTDQAAAKKEPTQLERLADKIINDLNDVSPDDVLQLYAPQLEEMDALDPASFKRVMSEIDAFREAAE